MPTTSLPRTAVTWPKPTSARRRRADQRPLNAPGAPDGSNIPLLQWWRHLPADAFTGAHVQRLQRAMRGIGMIGEPRWADAAHGYPAAAIGVAMRTIQQGSPTPIIDLTMSTVLIAALRGSTAAMVVLAAIIEHRDARNKQPLQRSWLDRYSAERSSGAAGSSIPATAGGQL